MALASLISMALRRVNGFKDALSVRNCAFLAFDTIEERKIKICPENATPIEYDLPDWTVRNAKYSPRGVDPNPYGEPRNLKQSCVEEEQKLRNLGQATAAYLDLGCFSQENPLGHCEEPLNEKKEDK